MLYYIVKLANLLLYDIYNSFSTRGKLQLRISALTFTCRKENLGKRERVVRRATTRSVSVPQPLKTKTVVGDSIFTSHISRFHTLLSQIRQL